MDICFKNEPLPPLQFPEWTDASLNQEIWEPPKEKGAKAKDAAPAEINRFEDPHRVPLPLIISSNVSNWKRPSEIFTKEKLVVYEDSLDYSNLTDGSKHLLHSEFVRYFVASVGIMEYLGGNKTLTIEGVSPKFLPTMEGEMWRPWHHIYSLTKAGKGQKHKPQANQLGKYVVRLFWMGCWRKITVDDMLPVDKDDTILLPSLPIKHSKSTETINPPSEPPPKSPAEKKSKSKGKGDKKGKDKKAVKEEPKETVQIWPYILSKALLKLASLTWNDQHEIIDFDIIHCFTGWIAEKIDVRELTILDKWEICTQFSDHYAWADDLVKSQASTSKSKKSKQSAKGKNKDKAGSSKSSRKGAKGVPSFLEQKDLTPPYYLIGVCSDLSSREENEVPDVTPCCSHLFYIDQSRDIPLVRPEPKPEIEFWKTFRWLAWAIRKGLIPPPDNMNPIKCLKLISTLRKQAKGDVSAEEVACIKRSVEVIEGVVLQAREEKQKENDTAKKDAKSSKGTSKKSKSSGSNKSKGKSTQLLLPLPDISIWCDFNKIWPHIEFLHIYFKSSKFESSAVITNIPELETTTDTKAKGAKSSSVFIRSINPSEFRNEPLYIFMDSLDYKFILFSLSQPGCRRDLLKVETKMPSQSVENNSEVGVTLMQAISENKLASVVEIVRSRRNLAAQEESVCEPCNSVQTAQPEEEIFSLGHLIVEEYNWQTDRASKIVVFLNSIGMKSILTNFGEGRVCLRLWVEASENYVLNILSDLNLVIGGLELILNHMTTESHRLMNCCFNVSSSYGQLVQSFGTPDYQDHLKKFYCSLRPDTTYKKLIFENVVNTFLENLLFSLRTNLNKNDYNKCATSLRALLFNTRIGYTGNTAGLINEADTASLPSEDILLLKEIQRAAVSIQAFFKRTYVQILKRRHNTIDKEYLNTFDFLKKIYIMCFSVEKRTDICLGLLRDVLYRADVRQYYTWIKDLDSVINVQSFNGAANVTFAKWIPICRYLFYCQAKHPVIVKICLFGEIEQYLIRVFDNDNGVELPRHTYNCNTNAYRSNAKGYTILCYGWSEVTKKAQDWRLVFATLRQQPSSPLLIKEVPIETTTLAAGYIPNIHQRVFCCNIVLQQDTLATFRMCTSYKYSKLLLKCSKGGKTLMKIYGKGTVILPTVFLECDSATEGDLRMLSKHSINLKRKRSSSKTGLNMDGRKFRDTKSDRTSVSSKAESKIDALARMASKEAKMMKRETVFVVEGFVLDDSWSLTEEEWEVVKGLKQKLLLGPPRMSMQRIGVKESVGSRTERKSYEKPGLNPDKPFWCLQTLVNKGDFVSVNKDTTREKEIKNIKRVWYDGHPNRYETSQNIRKDYLIQLWREVYESNDLGNSDTCFGERTCLPPDVILKMKFMKKLLNKYSLILLSQSDLLDRDLQTLEDDRRDLAYRQKRIEDFNQYQNNFMRDMRYYLHNQIERCAVLKDFIQNCRLESASTVEAIQEKRRQYVESLNPPALATEKKKGKKKK